MKDYSVCPKCKASRSLTILEECSGAFQYNILSNGEIDYESKEFVGDTQSFDVFCTNCNRYIDTLKADDYYEFVVEADQENN